jgi:hypothetical protein
MKLIDMGQNKFETILKDTIFTNAKRDNNGHYLFVCISHDYLSFPLESLPSLSDPLESSSLGNYS